MTISVQIEILKNMFALYFSVLAPGILHVKKSLMVKVFITSDWVLISASDHKAYSSEEYFHFFQI